MAEAVTNAGVTARANINEDGTVYYAVLADGAPDPTPAAIKAGAGAMRWGSMALTANTESTADIIRLYPETPLDIWFVAEDNDSNLQACPRKIDVTTMTGPPPLLGGAIFVLR